ncbi:hypothetical protein [Nocardioides perillae]|uniref:Uncharacterized protein n=1 Tax=Nocardioides perillae TaxID=1119534 RepID=A0A7Y9RVF9_9ACTN|nr:hypothetical protein [Nocardioides perillae]NYG55593.1 hypothetical protein [Nocardioides perillae]
MKKIASASVLGLTGLVTVGLLSLQAPSVSADPELAKREDDTPELVLVADDDDDDTNDQTRSRNTGVSRSTGDGTRSNFTRVSRDRDLSRSDKTRDFTRDGGKLKRDWSANRTNDRSRNDTRR